MIKTEDQEQLFTLIANYLEKDIVCVALGGTAMMFMGYKNTTKDIDLVFETVQERNLFIQAIKELGYRQRALATIYDEKRKEFPEKPVMFTRGDERFDLFVKTVFGYPISTQDGFVERRDYLGKKEFIIQVPEKEDLILLKAITGREKDAEDIQTIVKIEKDINWEEIVTKAIAQKKNNPWILIDLEETFQELKNITFIPSKHFNRLYAAQKS